MSWQRSIGRQQLLASAVCRTVPAADADAVHESSDQMPGIKSSLNSSFCACRSCIRKCWKWTSPWLHCHRPLHELVLVLAEHPDEYTILCLGLTGSGKTTLLHQLVDDSLADAGDPTTGFNLKTIPLSNLYPATGSSTGKSLSIREIGGSKAVRPFWSNYFQNKHAVIFVVNSAASEQELVASKNALIDVVADQRLSGRPFLIVGTHSDVAGARDTTELQLFFAEAMSKQRWSVRSCCAFNAEQVKSALQVLIDLMIKPKD